MAARPALVLLALALALSRTPTAPRTDSSEYCSPHGLAGVARDLHCIDLVPIPDLREAAGVVELREVWSPSGPAVTAAGHPLYQPTLSLAGLPDPASLGAYSSYVAWVTTPQLDTVVKLGAVGNGRWELGRVELNKFLVLVSAEPSAREETRQGKIVLRGTSPSYLLQPHGVSMLPGRRAPAGHEHGGTHAGWIMPPPHPAVPVMIPGLEALAPRTSPFLPGAGIDPRSLRAAQPHRPIDVNDGDTLDLRAGFVRRSIDGRRFTMYGFNGQYPGPLIRVRQNATIVVKFTNRIDLPTTVHWHGVRVDNRFDGTPGVTQEPVTPGGTFRYRVHFRDAGVYWYHPHVREDVEQALGLYGNVLVRSPRSDYWNPVNREETVMLEDLLIAPSGLFPYGLATPSHALMGRFGNVFLANGEPGYRLFVKRGEVVRFFFTNVSSTRTYNLTFDGTRMKLVGSDGGKLQREQWVTNVVLAPAERAAVEARFDRPGVIALTNRVQAINPLVGDFFSEVDTLGRIVVARVAAEPDHAATFGRLRENADVVSELDRYRPYFDKPVDHELLLTLRVKDLPFGLVQVLRLDSAYVPPVEWSGTMPMMDWLSTGNDVEWVLRDPATGRENGDIDWRFRMGEVVKIRLVNDRHTLHAMQHPIHIHGQRFLVLSRNGVPSDDLVWKDTVLVPAGSTVDILLELSNPGRWMLHCHIAEHLEAGMHLVFTVDSVGTGT